MPPEHHRRSCHSWALCFILMRSSSGVGLALEVKELTVPVLSLTKPTMEKVTEIVRSGDSKMAP
jgi:hypothetical protein